MKFDIYSCYKDTPYFCIHTKGNKLFKYAILVCENLKKILNKNFKTTQCRNKNYFRHVTPTTLGWGGEGL